MITVHSNLVYYQFDLKSYARALSSKRKPPGTPRVRSTHLARAHYDSRTVLLFESGKMVTAGATSESDVELVYQNTLVRVKSLEIHVSEEETN